MRKLGKQSWEMLIAGALSGLSWAPISWWPLGLLGWAWWMIGMTRGDQQRIFLKSLLFTSTSWIIAFHWLAFHPMPVAAVTSVVALLAFSCVFAAISALLIPRFTDGRPDTRLAAALLSMLLFEIVVSWGPFAMPSLSAGFAFTPGSWAMTVSSWVGIKGTSAVVGIWAALGAWLFVHRGKPSMMPVGLPVTVLLALTIIPLIPPSAETIEEGASISIHLVQPNASPESWSDVHDVSRVDRFDRLLAGVDSSLRDVQLTVFPETALPIGNESTMRAWVDRLAQRSASPVLAGGIETTEGLKARNVAYLSSDSSQRHAKVRLVPFAERVPFSEYIPGFNRFAVPAGGVEGYVPGTTRPLLDIPLTTASNGSDSLSLVPLICFESLFLRDARAGLSEGGDISVVITQDGWWGSDRARSQHLAFSQLLASATGHPVIHATVDGESALIDAYGQLAPLDEVSPSVLRGQLPTASRTTGFTRAGNAPFFGMFGALLALLIAVRLRHPDETSQPPFHP